MDVPFSTPVSVPASPSAPTKASVVLLEDICDRPHLLDLIEAGLVGVRAHPTDDLWILNYTAKAQYDRTWDHEVKMCRGLIVAGHPSDSGAVVVARPFPKFANLGEHGPDSPFGELPLHLPFEAHEKVDGSLAILYPSSAGPAIATRGSFESPQAVAATALLRTRYPEVTVPTGVTLLFEYISPWNRIVVSYGTAEELVALAAIDVVTGADVEFPHWPGRVAHRTTEIADFDELVATVAEDTATNAEGFVVRFPAGPDTPSHRVKLKYAEYLRLHRMVTGVSSVTVWEHLSAGLPIDELVDAVPDEFYDFVAATVTTLRAEQAALVTAAYTLADTVRDLPRKEAAGVITAQRDVLPGLVFAALDHKDVDAAAWKLVRPEFAQPFRDTAPSAD